MRLNINQSKFILQLKSCDKLWNGYYKLDCQNITIHVIRQKINSKENDYHLKMISINIKVVFLFYYRYISLHRNGE